LTTEEIEWQVSEKMNGLRQAVKDGKGSPWFRSFLAYMPFPTATRITWPVLFLLGDRDAHLLSEAMLRRGNDQV